MDDDSDIGDNGGNSGSISPVRVFTCWGSASFGQTQVP